MIDCININKIIPPCEVLSQQDEQIEAFGLLFDPVIKNGAVRKYVSDLNGLRLTLCGQELTIQNSLCKFFHGYNDQNFSYMDVLRAKSILEDRLHHSLNDAKVRNFEYGVVIKVAKPELTYNSLGMYKGQTAQKMSSRGRIYGIYYENTTHSIKFYNKTYEAKRYGYNLESGLLRIEKKVKPCHLNCSPRFSRNQINTFGDLCKRSTFQLLADDLVQSLAKIEINEIGWYDKDWTPRDFRLLGYMQCPQVRYLMKEHHHRAFEKDMKRYREINNDRQLNNHANFILKVMEVLENCIIN